jgi:hypothetical protein
MDLSFEVCETLSHLSLALSESVDLGIDPLDLCVHAPDDRG